MAVREAGPNTRPAWPSPPVLTASSPLLSGDTYGFLSEQGIVGQLGNASFSIVSNQDYIEHGGLIAHVAVCKVLVAAAKVITGQAPELDCGF